MASVLTLSASEQIVIDNFFRAQISQDKLGVCRPIFASLFCVGLALSMTEKLTSTPQFFFCSLVCTTDEL